MPGETILVVEDVDLLRDVIREMLEDEGFQVVAARNGQDALDKMANLAPDLIISDITMPVMDGFQFYKTMREHPEWLGVPFLFLTARSDPADLLAGRGLGADDYLTKPIRRDELVTTVQSRLNRFRQSQVVRVQQAYLDSLVALANAIEQRASSPGHHIQFVTQLTLMLAKRLGWSGRRIAMLQFAAVLHDIGKIHISANTLEKPGPLEPAEWEVLRRHPVNGAQMVKSVPFLADCAVFIHSHHERWDGRGYPEGLSGAHIPDGGRIIAVSDALASICSDRPYQAARSMEQAYTEIASLSGQAYDPEVIQALKAAWAAGEVQAILKPQLNAAPAGELLSGPD
jgi:putative two-component system response regulator